MTGAGSGLSSGSMIVASNLTKYYGDRPAVLDLSFEIGQGEIVGFLGLNGAGKTTTLRILSCLLVPTSGTVTVAGIDVLEGSHEIRKRIGYLPEVPPLYGEMTVRAFLEFAARLRGVRGAEVASRLAEVLAVTRIEEVADQVIATLSAGFRQRVGIAQAVVHRPSLLILDEPFGGLDPVQTVEMRDMVRGLGGEHTVLLSRHNLPQIHQTCDRILVIQRGQIVARGSEEELAARLAPGRARIEAEVRGEASDVASALDGLEGIESHEAVELEGGLVRVTVAAVDDVRETVAEALVTRGLGLRSLKRVELELEDVFVRLAREDGAEEPS